MMKLLMIIQMLTTKIVYLNGEPITHIKTI